MLYSSKRGLVRKFKTTAEAVRGKQRLVEPHNCRVVAVKPGAYIARAVGVVRARGSFFALHPGRSFVIVQRGEGLRYKGALFKAGNFC